MLTSKPFPPRHLRVLHTLGQTQLTVVDDAAAAEIRNRAKSKIAAVERLGHPIPALYDSFHRRHDYLRISLTERCNLRCFYCMPSEGTELSPSASILSDDEVVRLASLFVKNGVKKIRLTGGEPTVRKSIVDLVGRLRDLRAYGLQSIAMTSNGLALHRKLPALVDNGLTHLNLSLDTLDPFKFELMTRRMGHDAVLRSLELALNTAGLQSVKLNAVIIRGLNDLEVSKFIELTRQHPLSVRFIEFMPFNGKFLKYQCKITAHAAAASGASGNKWDKQKMIPSSALLARISATYPDICKVSDEVNDTARSYKVPDYRGSFGFISSMSDHFCGSCNRLRLTADGQIKVCLFDSKEVSLRDLMRNGASDEILIKVVRAALGFKKEKHAGMEDIDVINNRPMIKIGALSSYLLQHLPDHFRPKMIASRRSSYIFPSAPSGRHASSGNLQVAALRQVLTASFSSAAPGSHLTHIDRQGRPSMVDVSRKENTNRSATAQGRIFVPEIAYELVRSSNETIDLDGNSELKRRRDKSMAKGDVLTVAQLAGIMASKKTAELIPLCHPIPLSHVSVELLVEDHFSSGEHMEKSRRYSILCRATVNCDGKTGVEMEALSAVSVSLLTVWDMLKAVAGKEMLIDGICVTNKSGGRSGDFVRKVDETASSILTKF